MKLNRTAQLPPSIPASSLRVLKKPQDYDKKGRESADESAGGRFIELLASMLAPPAMTSDFNVADWPPKEP